MTFGDEVINRLADQGLGVKGVSIFLGAKTTLPSKGTCITVSETGGTSPNFVHNSQTPSSQRPGAQILVRAEDYEEAESLARRCYTALTLRNTVLSGTPYLSLTPTQEPFDLGLDDSERVKFAFNVMANKEPS